MNYQKIYDILCSKAKLLTDERILLKKAGNYFERHHIIPCCMGGLGKTYDVKHENVVMLTAKEHFICHRLLVLIYPDNSKLKYALFRMCNGSKKQQRYIPSAKIYKQIKEDCFKNGIKRSNHKHSEETKLKISKANKGKSMIITKEAIEKGLRTRQANLEKYGYVHANKGRKKDDDVRLKMSIAQKERTSKPGYIHHTTNTVRSKSSIDKAKISRSKTIHAPDYVSPKKGTTISDAHKLSISRANKGRQQTKESKEKRITTMKLKYPDGIIVSEETREKRRNLIVTDETKAKLSLANKNKKHAEETKLKMSNSHKGKIKSEEHRLNLSKSHKGKKVTDEHRLNLSIALKGRTLSDAEKLKRNNAIKINKLLKILNSLK